MDTIEYPSVTNFIDELNLDKVDRKIYDFVLKHKDCNENHVRNRSKACSQRWARIKLWRLVDRGIIEHKRVGKGFHKFRVSDRTLFNRISKQLEYIETQIVIFERPLLNIGELQDKAGAVATAGFAVHFVIPFRESMFTMLFRLLKLSDGDDIGKEGSDMLHTKILSLITKVTREPFYNLNYKTILSANKNRLNNFIQEVSKPGTVKVGLKIETLEKLVKNINEFEEKF